MEIISKQEAVLLGRKRFYTGRVCRAGHDCERYTVNGGCIDCINPKTVLLESVAPLESVTLRNGRVVQRISRDVASSKHWSVYFTGLPCNVGHIAERRVSDERCVECAHPVKYGPHAYTGWMPFSPLYPFRVPPGTPLNTFEELAKELQEAIPEILKKIQAREQYADVVAEHTHVETKTGNCVLLHSGRPEHTIQGYKLWSVAAPGVLEYDSRFDKRAGTSWWAQKDGVWYIIVDDKLTPAIVHEIAYDSFKPPAEDSEN